MAPRAQNSRVPRYDMDVDRDSKKFRGGAFALKYVLTVTASAIAELGTYVRSIVIYNS